jgi:hypothetical protein
MSCPSRFTPGMTQYPLHRKMGGPQGQSVQTWTILSQSDSIPRLPSPQYVTVPTVLPWHTFHPRALWILIKQPCAYFLNVLLEHFQETSNKWHHWRTLKTERRFMPTSCNMQHESLPSYSTYMSTRLLGAMHSTTPEHVFYIFWQKR